MPRTPKSLNEAIIEEPERFVKYFDLDKIIESKNPYKEFLKQFQRQFGSQQGLFLWNYILDNYTLTNKFYRLEEIQKQLPDKFKGDIDRETVKDFFEKYKERAEKKQKTREKRVKKPIKVSSYTREGKPVKGHSKTKGHAYPPIQEKFILVRKVDPLDVVVDEFNRYFGTLITKKGIGDKRLRLLGRKK